MKDKTKQKKQRDSIASLQNDTASHPGRSVATDRIFEENSILQNQSARALADYDNLRKRTDEEKITWMKFATQKLIQNLLPVLDTFESAQEHVKDSGLAIAINQFKDVLKSEGLLEIRPKVG